jgi:hypothetical protein
MDMFSPTNCGPGVDPTADAAAAALKLKIAESDAIERRHTCLRLIQERLTAEGLWGYPNLIRNPDGPWKEWQGAAASPDAHNLCWPATYTVREETQIFQITIHVQKACDDNPALTRAKAVLAEISTISMEHGLTHSVIEWN